MLIKAQVKYIQSLSHKKVRDTEGVFVAEGPKIINELLSAANTSPRQLFATGEWLEANAAQAASEKIIVITDRELERLSFLSTPHQVLGVFDKPRFEQPITFKKKLTLVLDALQDPGNMGTIIRSADWFGIGQVICSPDCADVFSPKVVQSTMGSITRVQVVYADIYQVLQQQAGIPLYAAALEGESVYDMQKPEEGVLMIGNESKGISRQLRSLHPRFITIPGKGLAESLNAAVATGILLSHLTQ